MMKRVVSLLTFLAVSFSMVHLAYHLSQERPDRHGEHHHEHCRDDAADPAGESLDDPCFEKGEAVKVLQFRAGITPILVKTNLPVIKPSDLSLRLYYPKNLSGETPFNLYLSGKTFLLI